LIAAREGIAGGRILGNPVTLVTEIVPPGLRHD
jgi:hypothetical protein